MRIKVKLLTKELEKKYEQFINYSPSSLLYHSLKYRNFLLQFLKNSKDYYFLAFIEDDLVGILPTFLKAGKYGNVINSLPFYGSHGSIITKNNHISQDIANSLLAKFNDFCKNQNCISSTIVDNYKNENCYLEKYHTDIIDERISQVTKLPSFKNMNKKDFEINLINNFDRSRRTDIRKGLKSGMDFIIDNSESSLNRLYEIHTQQMIDIGGQPKDLDVFKSIQDNFVKNLDYNIFTVSNNGKIICSILLFYHNKTVFYYMPAIDKNFKASSVMSANIFLAMKKSIYDDYYWWDWGGTWISQKGLLKFKSSWNTVNSNYKYYINYKKKLNKFSKADLLKEYKYFYLLPFNLLTL